MVLQFSYDKGVSSYITPETTKLMDLSDPGFPGWSITVDGLVEQPLTLDINDLLNLVHLESRTYRHRSVGPTDSGQWDLQAQVSKLRKVSHSSSRS